MTMPMLFDSRASDFANIMQQSVCTAKEDHLSDFHHGLETLVDLLLTARGKRQHVYVIGNGGSAAVASHIVTDFANVAKLCAATLHEPSLMTCMANDYGYENAFTRVVNNMIRQDDVLIAISSSGQSKNICQSAAAASERGAHVVTLTGFADSNPLRQLGKLNFWLNSKDYGFVEIGHLFLLHHISDCIGQIDKQAALA